MMKLIEYPDCKKKHMICDNCNNVDCEWADDETPFHGNCGSMVFLEK
jgi:hypothetical protein